VTTTGDTAHSTAVTGLANGASNTRYVRCQDATDPLLHDEDIIALTAAPVSFTL